MTVLGPFGYLGGWNSNTGPYDCPQDSYVDAQNMELAYGKLQKKKGNVRWTTNNHPGGSGIALGPVSYFQGVLVCAAAGSAATASPTAAGNWTDITGGATVGSLWASALNNILVFGGSTTLKKWTGSGNVGTLGGSPPPATSTCGTTVNNYLFVSGYSTAPWRVYWSAVLDPETWPAANFVDVKKDDNTAVTALFPFGEDLLIFKPNCVARFYTNQVSGSLGPLVIVNENIGCVGANMVDRLPDGRIVFMGFNNHVYIYDGNTFDDISNPPSPRSNIQNALLSVSLQGGYSSGCVSVYPKKNQIWISYPFTWVSALGTSFSFGVTFIYDYVNRIWLSPYPDHKIYDLVDYVNTGVEYYISAGYQYLFREDTGDYNDDVNGSKTFDAYVTKDNTIGGDARSFIPRSYFQNIYSSSFTGILYYGANGYNSPSLTKSISISTATSQDRKKVLILNTPSGTWNTLQTRFDGALSNQPFVLSPFYLSDEIEVQA